MSTTQHALADCFRDQAKWRLLKEGKYDDPRNGKAASALNSFADYVETLPDDAPVEAVARVASTNSTGGDNWTVACGGIDSGLWAPNPAASRIGFSHEPADDLDAEFTRYVRGNIE